MEFLDPVRVVALTGIAQGETVVDVGAGPGFFVAAMLAAVGPEGLVYAVDIAPEMLARLATVLGEQPQLKMVKSQELAIPLDNRIADHVFLADVIHEVSSEDRVAFLQELQRLLRPSGRITIVDWRTMDTPVGPPVEDRLSREDLVADLYRANFRLRRSDEAGPYHYLIQASLKEGIFAGDYRP